MLCNVNYTHMIINIGLMPIDFSTKYYVKDCHRLFCMSSESLVNEEMLELELYSDIYGHPLTFSFHLKGIQSVLRLKSYYFGDNFSF